MENKQLTSEIIRAAITVHNELGPGLLESVYQKCLMIELDEIGLEVASEVAVPIEYRGTVIDDFGFRMDLLVEDTVVVELKSVEKLQDIHKKQLLSYLRLADKPIGLLMNFNKELLKDGIVRIANSNPQAEASNRFPTRKSV